MNNTTKTPKSVLKSGMPAARFKYILEDWSVDTSFKSSYSRNNSKANRYAAADAYRRKTLKDNIIKDIANFDFETICEVLKLITIKNCWFNYVSRNLKDLTAHQKMKLLEVNEEVYIFVIERNQ